MRKSASATKGLSGRWLRYSFFQVIWPIRAVLWKVCASSMTNGSEPEKQVLYPPHIVETHQSFGNAENVDSLFKTTFSNSSMAACFSLGKTKATHLIKFELMSHYFEQRLLKIAYEVKYFYYFCDSRNIIKASRFTFFCSVQFLSWYWKIRYFVLQWV